jgi:hypothetical protein
MLAAALAPHLAELLGLNRSNAVDDWLDVAEELPTCKRALYRACRTGALPGRRIKRRWLVRRADFDAWIETHETGAPPAPQPAPHTRALTPAQEHEREMDALRARLGGRRLTDAERAAKGMPSYDVEREYQEFLAKIKEDEEEQAAKERADNDPQIAAQRAAAIRAADAAKARRPSKSPRVRCERCARIVTRRKDGRPLSHACPHGYGSGCYDTNGNSTGAAPRCPWCAKDRDAEAMG